MVIRNCAVATAQTMKSGIFGEQRKLAGFEAVVVAEHQRDEARPRCRCSTPRPAARPIAGHGTRTPQSRGTR